MFKQVFILVLLGLAVGTNLFAAAPSFKAEIAPLLVQHCVGCHGPKKAGGEWRADTFARLAEEGDSATAGFGADLESSEAWRRIVSDDPLERMPLDADPLSAEQIAQLKSWIEAGKPFDGPDPQATLLSYIPATIHPPPPEKYPAMIPITALVFGPDGKELFASGYQEVTVWNPETGELLRRIDKLPQRTYHLAVSPDGSLLVAAGGNPGRLGEVRLFQRDTGELQRVLGVSSDVVFAAAFRLDGKQIATGAADGLVRIFDVASGEEKTAINSHSDWVFDLAWQADGKQLAAASRDGTAKVFSAANGKLVASFNDHNAPVRGVVFSSDGNYVYSSGENDRVYRWRVKDAKKEGEITLGGDGGILVAAENSFLATGNEPRLRLISRQNQNEVRQFDGLTGWTTAAAFDAANQRVAGGSLDGQIAVWDAKDGKLITKFAAAPGRESGPTR